jgi:hypothetical protein
MDARHRYISTLVADGISFNQSDVDKVINADLPLVEQFFTPAGPKYLYFVAVPAAKDGAPDPEAGNLSMGCEMPQAIGRAVYFIRLCGGEVSVANVAGDLGSGKVTEEGLECFQTTLQVSSMACCPSVTLHRSSALQLLNMHVLLRVGSVCSCAREYARSNVGTSTEAAR